MKQGLVFWIGVILIVAVIAGAIFYEETLTISPTNHKILGIIVLVLGYAGLQKWIDFNPLAFLANTDIN